MTTNLRNKSLRIPMVKRMTRFVDNKETTPGAETLQVSSDLEDRHKNDNLELLVVKNDSTKDLKTIFSDRVDVKFKSGDKCETLRGRWCLPCKFI
jgi:hypothetical protein